MKSKNVLAALFSMAVWSQAVYGQCGTETVTVTDYCKDQYAEFSTALGAGEFLKWYSAAPTDPVAQRLNKTDNGSYFASPTRYATGSGVKSFYYIKEYSAQAGLTQPTVRPNASSASASITFVPTEDISLSSLNVNVQSDNLGPNARGLSLTLAQGGAAVANGTASATYNDAGAVKGNGYYTVSVSFPKPILKKGLTYTLSVSSDSDVKIALYTATEIATRTGSAVGSITPATDIPGISDWNINIICTGKTVTAKEQTDATKCCVPVPDTDKPSIGTSPGRDPLLPNIVLTDGIQSVGMQSSILVDTLFYSWYKDGVEVNGGKAMMDYANGSIGQYKLRIANKAADLSRKSCYQESDPITISKKMLSANPSYKETCAGEAVQLTLNGSMGGVQWQSTDGNISDLTSFSPTFLSVSPGLFTYKVLADVADGELVINGDFEAGATGFTSAWTDYTAAGAGMSSAKYLIAETVSYDGQSGYNYWMDASVDAKGNNAGRGKYFIADGSSDANKNKLWYQTVAVSPNTTYTFSALFANIACQGLYDAFQGDKRDATKPKTPGIFAFTINGKEIGSSYSPTGNVGIWGKHEITYTTSSSETSLSIGIINKSTQTDGNDFAMDQISFRKGLSKQFESFTVKVNDCLKFDVSNNVTICKGTSTDISASTNGVILGWEPAAEFADMKKAVQTVTPTKNTRYKVTVGYPAGNLIENGDFEKGNFGFTSQYPLGVGAGNYTITDNPNKMNGSWFVKIGDHTTGTGKMYVADGGNIKDDVVWASTVSVKSGEEYAFSAWVANVQKEFFNPAKLSFYANGEILGQINAGKNETWVNVYQLYTATSTGDIIIELKNEVEGQNGNDFALDDIVFSPVSAIRQTKEIRVTVKECTPPATDQFVTVCEDTYKSGDAYKQDITILADTIMNHETGYTLEWYADEALTMPQTNAHNLVVTDGSTFWAKTFKATEPTIFSKAKVVFTVNALPDISFSNTDAVCAGSAAFTVAGLPAGGTFAGTGITATGVFDPQTAGSFPITYQATDANGCTNSGKTTLTVNENPVAVFGAIASKCSYAASGDIAAAVTVTGGAAKKSDAFSSSSAGLVGSTFSPRVAGAGVHTIAYTYEDINGCKADAQGSITVNAQPAISFTLQADACKLDAPITLSATSPDPGTGVWQISPANATDGTFDPSLAALETPHTVRYIYTATATTCADTAEQTITVHHAEPPTGKDESVVIPSTAPFPAIPQLTATGTGLKWYLKGTTTLVGTGSPFTTGKTKDDIDIHIYDVTQTVNGCESKPAQVQLEISNCTAKKPTVENTSLCIGEPATALSATAQGAGTLGWSTVAKFDDKKTDYPATFVPTETAVGSYTYYVSEYDVLNTCWGLSSPVTFTIHPKPEITIQVKDFFCSSEASAEVKTSVKTALTPASTIEVFTINGTASAKTFDPAKWGDKSGSYEIYYKVTETIDPAKNKTCEADVKKTVAVEYVAPPVVPALTSWLTSKPGSPAVTATGTAISWYTKADLSDIPSTTNPLTVTQTPKTQYDFMRYATQTSVKGCTSKSAESKITFVDCNTPAPAPGNVSVCENAASIPAVTATGDNIRWYESASAASSISTGNTYQHGKTAPGTYTYFASQEQDLTGEGACEGERTAVTLVIYPKPIPAITGNTQACKGGTAVTLAGTNKGANLGSGTWTALSGLTPAGNNASFSPTVAGNYTFELTWTDANNCIDKTTAALEVVELPQPTPADDNYMVMVNMGNPMPTLNADPLTGATINWYNASAQKIGTGSPFAGHGKTEADLGEYSFTARYAKTINTGEECLSQPATRTLTITDCPVPAPVKLKDETKCFGAPAPELTVSEGTWPTNFGAQGQLTYRWYYSNGTTRVTGISGPKYSPQDEDKGEYTYRVSMFDQGQNAGKGCEGAKVPVKFTVIKTDKPTIKVSDPQLCENEALPVFTATGSNIKWFNALGTEIKQGTTYNATETAPGTYVYSATQTVSGCEGEKASSQYTVTAIPATPILTSGTECAGRLHMLDATATGTVNWVDEFGHKYSGTPLFLDDNDLVEDVAVKFTATATAATGCVSLPAETTYEMRSIPAAPVVADANICMGDKKIEPLRAIGTNINWYYGQANYDLGIAAAENQDTLLPSEEIRNSAGAKTYYVTQTVRNCQSPAQILTFSVGYVPTPEIVGDSAICPFLTNRHTYNIDSVDDANTYEWEFTRPNTLVNNNFTETNRELYYELTYSGIDVLRVTETTPIGCRGVTEMVIVAPPMPELAFEYTVSPMEKTITFSNQTRPSGIADTLWSADEKISIPLVHSFIWEFSRTDKDTAWQYPVGDQMKDSSYHLGAGPNSGNQLTFAHGYYDVKLIAVNQFGCRSRQPLVRNVFMNIPSAMYVPNSFAPAHGSEAVAQFLPKGFNLQSYKLWVYDSWGNTVFYSDALINGQPAQGWNGCDKNGNPMPADVYMWKIDAQFENGETWKGLEMENGKFRNMGNLMLLR